MKKMFDSFMLGGRPLRNRIAMAPLTRARSPDNIATERNALYYAQRATAGLIVSEGSPISREGQGYLFNPGIGNTAQVEGWKTTTTSVHAVGGTIFAQIWHVGRVSHVTLQENGIAPVSSSDKIAEGAWTYAYDQEGRPAKLPSSPPRALETSEIARVINDFAQAAENAIAAGFDGVEIHGANGYLIEQFINPLVNDRTDGYGAATIESRIRFALDVVDAIIARIGRERTAIRLSPYAQDFGMPLYADIEPTYAALVDALGERRIAYVHVMDHTESSRAAGKDSPLEGRIYAVLSRFRTGLPHTALIVAGNMTPRRAETLIESDAVDMVAFGRPFIANPDLVERLRHGWPLADSVPSNYYEGGAQGYIDFPPYRDE